MNGCIDCGKSWPLTAQQHFRPDFSSKSKYEGWTKFPFSLIWGKETHFQSPGNKCGMRRQLLPIPNKAPRSRELQIQERSRLRMRSRAAWSGDKVREGKTSRRSLPWPVMLSFTGLPRYLARMANSERWSKTRHGPGILSRRLNASPDKTRAKQKSWVGPQQTFKILKRVCAGRKISLSSFLITTGNPNNIIKNYL